MLFLVAVGADWVSALFSASSRLLLAGQAQAPPKTEFAFSPECCKTSWGGKVGLGEFLRAFSPESCKTSQGQQTDALSTTMDFLPSITKLIGGDLPSKKIDGIEMSDLFFSNENSSKRDSFLYYNEDELEAIRYKNWKLHFKKEAGWVINAEKN